MRENRIFFWKIILVALTLSLSSFCHAQNSIPVSCKSIDCAIDDAKADLKSLNVLLEDPAVKKDECKWNSILGKINYVNHFLDMERSIRDLQAEILEKNTALAKTLLAIADEKRTTTPTTLSKTPLEITFRDIVLNKGKNVTLSEDAQISGILKAFATSLNNSIDDGWLSVKLVRHEGGIVVLKVPYYLPAELLTSSGLVIQGNNKSLSGEDEFTLLEKREDIFILEYQIKDLTEVTIKSQFQDSYSIWRAVLSNKAKGIPGNLGWKSRSIELSYTSQKCYYEQIFPNQNYDDYLYLDLKNFDTQQRYSALVESRADGAKVVKVPFYDEKTKRGTYHEFEINKPISVFGADEKFEIKVSGNKITFHFLEWKAGRDMDDFGDLPLTFYNGTLRVPYPFSSQDLVFYMLDDRLYYRMERQLSPAVLKKVSGNSKK